MSFYLKHRETHVNPAEYTSDNEVECAACHRMIDAENEAYQLENGQYLCTQNERNRICFLTCHICKCLVYQTAWFPGSQPKQFHTDSIETEQGWAHKSCIKEDEVE